MNKKIKTIGAAIKTLLPMVWKSGTAVVIFLFMCGAAVQVSANGPWPVIEPPQGFSASGSPEIYTPATLYEKIDGQAELYLSAGFLELKSYWFERVDDAGAIMEMNVYRMGSLLNAFAVYSQQQRHDARKLDIAQFAYQIQSAVFLVHGPYYVEILPSEFSTPMTDLARQLAEQLIKTTRVENGYLKEIEYFPADNMDKGSITVISKNAFGMDGLDNVFMATYTLGDGRLTAYMSHQKTPEAAKQLVNEVYGYFMAFGGTDIKSDINIEGVRMLEVMDNYELIFSIGPYLAGVHEGGTRLQAEKMGRLMHRSLQERLR